MNFILVIVIKLFSYLPYPLLRAIALKLYYINAYTIKYRYNVVDSNLSIAFPNNSSKENKKIRTDFFKYFFNLILEITKMFTISKKEINKRVEITNLNLIEQYAKNNKTILLVFGHYNNWEWVGQKLSVVAKQKVVGIYKPLSDKTFDNLLKEARTKFGAVAVSMEESMRYIINTKDECQILGIIADQNPVVNKSTKWLPFFNKEVPVFLGIEKIAKKMDYPVVFCDMKQIGNGKYSITFEVLENNPKNTEKLEITKQYINRLEQQIIKEPSYWLWSHRRWKHKRQQ